LRNFGFTPRSGGALPPRTPPAGRQGRCASAVPLGLPPAFGVCRCGRSGVRPLPESRNSARRRLLDRFAAGVITLEISAHVEFPPAITRRVPGWAETDSHRGGPWQNLELAQSGVGGNIRGHASTYAIRRSRRNAGTIVGIGSGTHLGGDPSCRTKTRRA